MGEPLPDLAAEVARLRRRVRDLERANAELARRSTTDELTRLPNYRAFREALSRELKRSLRSSAPLALALFDVDDFKGVNDRYGHAVGDAILARVAEVMRDAVRQQDLLSRYGGEEFALLAPDTGLAGAFALAEKVRLSVSEGRYSVIALDGPRQLRITLSAGVAVFCGDERRLFNEADRALYLAKSSGKDCTGVLGEPGATPSSPRSRP